MRRKLSRPAPLAVSQQMVPCAHRGEQTRVGSCDLCGNKGQPFAVFVCDLHGECSLGRSHSRLRPCLTCRDLSSRTRESSDPILNTPLIDTPTANVGVMRRSLIFHCYPARRADWRAACLSTFRYRHVFNGKILISITTGEDCETPGRVVDWFMQFGADSEIRIVNNVASMGINTTFRDQLRAIQHEEGIVFKSHTKGITHASNPSVTTWRDNMANGCLSDIALVEEKFQQGFRSFATFKTTTDEGANVMDQLAGQPRCQPWSGWHYPGAFFWFDPRFIPEEFFQLPLHHYENEAFPCHLGPTETGFSLTPNDINFFQPLTIGTRS